MLPLVVVCLLTAVLLAPGLVAGPSLDAAVFTHVAGQLNAGGTLYLDTWDHKPPIVYLLYAGGQWLLPFADAWLVTWLIAVVATAAAGLLLHAIAIRLGVRRPIALLAAAAAVVGMAQYLVALGGGLTEPVATVPLGAALLLVLRSRLSPRSALAAGALLGLTPLVAIPTVAAVLAVGLLALARLRSRPLEAGLLVLGGVVPALLTAAWLLAIGAWNAALDAVLGYAVAYRTATASAAAELSGPAATWTTLSLLFLVVPAILGAMSGMRRLERRPVTLAMLLWLAASLVLFAYQGRFFAHYAIPLAIPLALLAAFGLERVEVLRGLRARPSRTLLLYTPLAFGAAISLVAGFLSAAMELAPVAADHRRSAALAPVIQSATSADDAMWVWGNEPEIYLAADRPSATRYSYLYPLVTPGYATAQMVADALAQLEADPPALVVDAGSARPGLAGFQRLLLPRPMVSDGRDLDILDPLRAFVAAHYEEGPTVDGWVVYRLVTR